MNVSWFLEKGFGFCQDSRVDRGCFGRRHVDLVLGERVNPRTTGIRGAEDVAPRCKVVDVFASLTELRVPGHDLRPADVVPRRHVPAFITLDHLVRFARNAVGNTDRSRTGEVGTERRKVVGGEQL